VSDIKIPLGRLKFVTSEINAVKLKEKIESENKEWEGWKKLNFAKYKKVIEIWKKHGMK
jgi:cell division protein FtsL